MNQFTTPCPTPRRLFYMIEITEVCSLACPVCYASATPGHGQHHSINQILALGLLAKKDGGRFVELIGGEPAEHPELFKIVSELRKIGLRPVLTTNGVRLGSEPEFALGLYRAGLHKANIQFDTLDAGTSIAMRGQDLLMQKRQAISNAAAAGLRIGLITTLCHLNIHETRDILCFALGHTPYLNTITFQSMITMGRYPATLRTVEREAILDSLLSSIQTQGPRLSPSDIMPPPQYPPWRALPHPACSSLLFLCKDTGSTASWSLARDVNLERLYSLLQLSNRYRSGVINTVLRPLIYLWCCTRPGGRLTTLRRFVSLVSGRGGRNLFIVNVDSSINGGPEDEERLKRCPACFVTEKGFISACARLCIPKTCEKPVELTR